MSKVIDTIGELMNSDNDLHALFHCECHTHEHMVSVDVHTWTDSEPDFCMSVTADLHIAWYHRIWLAIKYIFGQPSLSWHDVLLNPTDVAKLENMIAHYKMHLNNYNLNQLPRREFKID